MLDALQREKVDNLDDDPTKQEEKVKSINTKISTVLKRMEENKFERDIKY